MGYKETISFLHPSLVVLEHSYHVWTKQDTTRWPLQHRELTAFGKPNATASTEAACDCVNVSDSYTAQVVCVEFVIDLNPKMSFTETVIKSDYPFPQTHFYFALDL